MAVDHIGREGETLKGLMQNQPLLLSSLLKHADRFHAKTEIVSRTLEGPIHC
jgi:fatty-acyl-CoA synthase